MLKYKLQKVRLLLALIISTFLLLVSSDTLQTFSYISPLLVEPLAITKKCPKIKIWKIAFIEWNKQLPLRVVEELQPYPDGAYGNSNVPDPKHKPMRPYVETYANSTGIAGEMKLGNYQETGIVFQIKENLIKFIKLPSEPITLSMRQDGGIWVKHYGELLLYNALGKQVRVLDGYGTDMVNVESDAVWLINFEKTASFVSATGDVSKSYPWDGFNTSSARGQNICRLNIQNQGYIECLEPNGKQNSISLPFSKNAHGKILNFTDKNIFTLGYNKLSYYDNKGIEAELQIQNAGLTTNGEPFISLERDDDWSEVCLSNATSKFVPVKYDATHLKKKNFIITNMIVAAVDNERTLTFNYDRAEWVRGNRIESTIIDENSYRKKVFPYIWSLSSGDLQPLNADDGTVIMSATGPNGIALIGLKWSP